MKKLNSNLFWRFKIFLAMVSGGIVLNFLLANFAIHFKIPLYLDCVGSILVAMLGGTIPAILVGFFSNVINSIYSPVTLYYGIISILIAVCASHFHTKRYFKHVHKTILVILVFAVLGGGLGSVLTWFLFGFSFGEGFSAPLAHWLFAHGVSNQFSAQLGADFVLDVVDKAAVVVMALWIYRALPQKVKLQCLPSYRMIELVNSSDVHVRHTLLRKVIVIVVIAEILLGAVACSIGFFLYRDVAIRNYTAVGQGVVDAAAILIDPERVDAYLAEGRSAEGYAEVEKGLYDLQKSFPQVTYLYAYQILPDGCHVVFDLDAEGGVEASEIGSVIPFDSSFIALLPDLLAGKEIDPIITDDTYGWLLTVYKPIKNKEGRVVAYVASDVSMEQIVHDDATFFIKTLSLFFGISIIIMSFILEAVKRGIVFPVNAMARGALRFAYNTSSNQESSLKYLQSLNIPYSDEIGNLYRALTKMAEDSIAYIKKVKLQAAQMEQMQEEIIINFAELVEARDQNTGEHIKSTAYYVDRIARQMQKEGMYADVLTDDYIEKLVQSAPLHDIGKIKISDLILNKPGKLTDDEFAIMKTHTTEGYNVLTHIIETSKASMSDGYMNEAVEMARYHHEKWDGSGYPMGISGEQIPLSARIMAVADVFDALTMERAYKKPFSYEKTMSILVEGAGKHFDPNVITAFEHIAESLYKERQAKNAQQHKEEAAS